MGRRRAGPARDIGLNVGWSQRSLVVGLALSLAWSTMLVVAWAAAHGPGTVQGPGILVQRPGTPPPPWGILRMRPFTVRGALRNYMRRALFAKRGHRR